MFLREVMDKIVFSSLITLNGMLSTHCDNLSIHHYHATYHPCFDKQFRQSQTKHSIFALLPYQFQKKAKAIELPFCTK